MRGLRTLGSAGWSRSRIAGAALVGGMVVVALLGPALVSASPTRQNLGHVLASPSLTDPLGTDQLGRSVLARVVHAARLSMGFAAASVLAAAIPGTILGLAAAFAGGLLDRLLSTAADAMLALPGLLFVLLIVAIEPGAFWPMFLGLALVQWIEWFRVVRAASAPLLRSPAAEAARLLGFGPVQILRRHVLPDLLPLLGTLAAFGLAGAVLAIGALGFVEVGFRPPTPEWGLMLVELLPYFAEAPVAILSPAACLFTLVLGLQLLARRNAR